MLPEQHAIGAGGYVQLYRSKRVTEEEKEETLAAQRRGVAPQNVKNTVCSM